MCRRVLRCFCIPYKSYQYVDNSWWTFSISFILQYEHLEYVELVSPYFVLYYFRFSVIIWMFVWSYGSCAYQCLVSFVFVFVVVFAVVDSAFFLSTVFSAFVTAVHLSVMGFLIFFAAVGTFSFWVLDFNFHMYHCLMCL